MGGKWTEEQRKKFKETMAAKKTDPMQVDKPKKRRKKRSGVRASRTRGKGMAQSVMREYAINERVGQALEALTIVETMGWPLARDICKHMKK